MSVHWTRIQNSQNENSEREFHSDPPPALELKIIIHCFSFFYKLLLCAHKKVNLSYPRSKNNASKPPASRENFDQNSRFWANGRNNGTANFASGDAAHLVRSRGTAQTFTKSKFPRKVKNGVQFYHWNISRNQICQYFTFSAFKIQLLK